MYSSLHQENVILLTFPNRRSTNFESEPLLRAMSREAGDRACAAANLTIKALVDVILASFSQPPNSMPPDVSRKLTSGIESYLRKESSYGQLLAEVSQYVTEIGPIEKLRNIVEMSSDPIAAPILQMPGAGNRRPARVWTAHEDNRLLAGILKFGIENWTPISKFVGNGRTRTQCSQRWYRGLNPVISKDHWSPEEEGRLLSLIETYGVTTWTEVARKLGGRSDVQCRYRYQQILKRTRLVATDEGWEDGTIAPSIPLQPVVMMRYVEGFPIYGPHPTQFGPPQMIYGQPTLFPGQMPPITGYFSPMSQYSSPGIPISVHAGSPSFAFSQSPITFPSRRPESQPTDFAHEQPAVGAPIIAPAFDGKIFSVC
jgi:hypothetical protein